MVAVRDVGHGNAGERGRECVIAIRRDRPYRVSNAVGSRKVVQWRVRAGCGHDGVDLCVVLVGEEGGAGVGMQRLDVPRAVILLVLARLLVLLEYSGKVVLRVERCDDAGLRVIAHHLAIGVERGSNVLHESATSTETVEGLLRLDVSLWRGTVSPVGHVDLGAGNVKETEGIPGRKGAGFCGIDHIIGNGGNKRCRLGRRADRSEGTYVH